MIKSKVFTMVVTGSIFLSSYFNVFAFENDYLMVQQQKTNCIERHHKKGYKFNVEKWVEEGIISQEQADKWKKFNEKRAKIRKKEMDKVKKMTEEERKAYFKKRKNEEKDYFEELVDEKIITKEQIQQIKEKIIQRHIEKNKKSK